MADLNSLIDQLRTMFLPGQQYRQSDATFGPSVSRIGRTPIGFTTNIPATSGMYTPPEITGPGRISINPISADNRDVGATIAHEDIHSILNRLDQSGKLKDMSESNPYFKDVSKAIASSGRGGEMYAETPAYMGAFTDAFTPSVPVSLRKLYTDYFQKQLFEVDPKAAASYARIANLDYIRNNMRVSSDAGTVKTNLDTLRDLLSGAKR